MVSLSLPRPVRVSSSSTIIGLFLVFMCLAKPSLSQFGNIFEQFFQQDESDGPHRHHSGHSSGQGSSDKFKMVRDQTRCSDYLCPSTLDCVASPSDCPCPFIEDIKCPISIPVNPSSSATLKKFQDSFICTRAPGCSQVQKALKFGS
ncbi:Long chronological lifespan protein 2 [Puccinia graminis f. sp. tritici]|uniref:Long chronological lifespan protein 2 n=1 Tax=Puccinia graminis f. sp. tritici TaxID=56615 RepID=A0A5B0P4F3_PUCGR|nr:Long chronological lifespan protein 2 [Puccinia graminis f. sp. tritici]KAA1094998.1 Long chronological lifespan protein 2 [Puccinia graminis f. sp. tritici]